MKFWDSSALLPLIIEEFQTAVCVKLFSEDRDICIWWGSEAEIVSALARREREGLLSEQEFIESLKVVTALQSGWYQVAPHQSVKETAKRVLRIHPLRAVDAFQLAAVLTFAEGQPSELDFVCLDERLPSAVLREGLRVNP